MSKEREREREESSCVTATPPPLQQQQVSILTHHTVEYGVVNFMGLLYICSKFIASYKLCFMGFGHFSGNRFRVIALESSGELSYLLSLRIKLFHLLQSIINYHSRPPSSRQIVYKTLRQIKSKIFF